MKFEIGLIEIVLFLHTNCNPEQPTVAETKIFKQIFTMLFEHFFPNIIRQ